MFSYLKAFKPPLARCHKARAAGMTLMAASPRSSIILDPTQPKDKKNGKVPSNKTDGQVKEEIKLLMLHGYTQSGPLFRAKTRAMEKLLVKLLAPINLVPRLTYPTAPIKLSTQDIPGYESNGQDDDEPEAYAWFRKNAATGEYMHFEQGMQAVADAVKECEGGVDGIIGFSQGGAVAAMIAAAMEASRNVPASHSHWVEALRVANGGRRFRFAVVYSGFWAPPQDLQWLYEPHIETPTMHFLGSLDSVVVEERSTALIQRCKDTRVATHPGGHYVPVSREWVSALCTFVREIMASSMTDGRKISGKTRKSETQGETDDDPFAAFD